MNNVYGNRYFVFMVLITCLHGLRANNHDAVKDTSSVIASVDKFVTTPLHEMVIKQFNDKNTKLKNIEELLKSGADVNAQNEDHRTPLWLVTFYGGDIDIIILLIKYGADITIPDLFNETPLHNIVTRNNMEAAAILIDTATMMKPDTVEKMITFKDDAQQSPLNIVQTEEMEDALLDESSHLQQ